MHVFYSGSAVRKGLELTTTYDYAQVNISWNVCLVWAEKRVVSKSLQLPESYLLPRSCMCALSDTLDMCLCTACDELDVTMNLTSPT